MTYLLIAETDVGDIPFCNVYDATDTASKDRMLFYVGRMTRLWIEKNEIHPSILLSSTLFGPCCPIKLISLKCVSYDIYGVASSIKTMWPTK